MARRPTKSAPSKHSGQKSDPKHDTSVCPCLRVGAFVCARKNLGKCPCKPYRAAVYDWLGEYLNPYWPSTRSSEVELVHLNRAKIIEAISRKSLTRRELVRLGLLSGAGSLVVSTEHPKQAGTEKSLKTEVGKKHSKASCRNRGFWLRLTKLQFVTRFSIHPFFNSLLLKSLQPARGDWVRLVNRHAPRPPHSIFVTV